MIHGTSEGLQNEADQLGIQYAWNAGYDPRGFIAFLDSLSSTPDNNFLSDEPPLNERLLNAFSEIQYLPEQKGGAYESGEFDRVRSRLAR